MNDYIAYMLIKQHEERLQARIRRGHVEALPRAGRRSTTRGTGPTDGQPGSAAGGGPGLAVFAVTAAGALLVSLDVSVANALMPAIGGTFPGAGRAALAWVITGYAIVLAAALVPAGRLADRTGRRRAYVSGLGVFAVGSLICGVAPDLAVLLVGRAVQGLGAAAASPASLGLLLAASDQRHRAVHAARWTGAAAVGVCLGPLVGGALSTEGTWRWAFLVNLPVVAVVAVSARHVLSPSERRTSGRPLTVPLTTVPQEGSA